MQPGLAELTRDHREELRRGRQVEDAVQRVAGTLVELVQGPPQLGVDLLVIERSGDVADLVDQPLEHVRIRPAAGEALDRLLDPLAELFVRLLAARDPDQLEALGKRALVGEVVERRQQLPMREIAGRAEDHERRRMHRQALEPLDERVFGLLPLDRGGGHGGASPVPSRLDRVGVGRDGLDRVAAELVAQRRQHARRVVAVARAR